MLKLGEAVALQEQDGLLCMNTYVQGPDFHQAPTPISQMMHRVQV